MPSPTLFFSVPILLLLFFCIYVFPSSALAPNTTRIANGNFLTQKVPTNRTIIVDINGNGHFTSIQEAIDSVPDGNNGWVIVHVRKGVYREKVHIPKQKPFIFLRGNGRGRTAIVWSQSSSNNVESATFKAEAKDLIISGISIKNEAPTGAAYTSQNQSVAAFVAADKIAFYHCAFYSTHNTLFDYKGRHYYDTCYIQGSIDFIFGRGRTVFHNCEMFVIGDKRVSIHGSVTAPSRESEKEISGFIFIGGKVYGIGGVYLGRAKGPYSRAIFAETYLSKTIVPAGWTNWSYAGSTEHLYHAEYRTHGPGATTEGRAPWSRQLTEEEVAPFLSIDYIDGKHWLPAWL